MEFLGCDAIFEKGKIKNFQCLKMSCLLRFAAEIWQLSDIKTNATKLDDFLKIIWQQFDMTRSSPRDLRFHGSHILTGMFLKNFDSTYFKIKQKLSSSILWSL